MWGFPKTGASYESFLPFLKGILLCLGKKRGYCDSRKSPCAKKILKNRHASVPSATVRHGGSSLNAEAAPRGFVLSVLGLEVLRTEKEVYQPL